MKIPASQESYFLRHVHARLNYIFRLPVRSGVAEFTQWYMSRNRVGYFQANCFEK